jgi:hypothetical protein
MSQEGKRSRIADDFRSIAARMRELSDESRQVATRRECSTCNDRGWLWSSSLLDWRGCTHCGMAQHFPKPPPRR